MKISGYFLSLCSMSLAALLSANSAAQDYPTELQERVESLSNVFAATQSYTDSDGFTHWRSEIVSGCSFSDHSYALDIDVDPERMSDISYRMSNYDVDYNDPQFCEEGPEVDRMYFNDHDLGILTGANDSWSINAWSLNRSQVVKGSNSIFIDTDSTGTGCWCVGVGYIEVTAKVDFQVVSHTPSANEKNRDFGFLSLGLEATFSIEYDPDTLNEKTFNLEYRDKNGAWQKVSGIFDQLAPETFEFLPDFDLEDGVKYRVTIKGGNNGVKSAGGAPLEKDVQWSFWTVPNLDLSDSFGGNVCAPSADPCPGLEVAVFQVARNAALVSGKDAVARVFARWKKHDDIYDSDQVKRLTVDIALEGGGITGNKRATVKRPDLYTAAEKKPASNSVNIYHTPTSGASYSVELTPTPQSNDLPVTYTATVNPGSTGKTPNISFDYYFLKDGAWSGGVPAAAKTGGRNLMTAGALYITDEWPALTTSYTEKPEFSIGYTFTGNTINSGCNNVKEVACPLPAGVVGPPQAMAELYCVYEKLATMLGGKKFVAATVPNGLCPGATAFALANKVFMHQDGANGNDGTVAHEVGHIYGISTANNPNSGHRNDSTGTEGFQVRLKKNRSFTEDPTNAVSLMHTTLQPQGTQWVHNADYNTLIGTVAAAPLANRMTATAASGGYLIVTGYIDLGTQTATLAPAFLQDLPNDVPVPGGSCQAALLNQSASILSSADFDPGVDIHIDSQGTRGGIGGGALAVPAAGPQFFSASLPWDPAAEELRVTCNGALYASRVRSQDAPQVAFVNVKNGDVLSGLFEVQWQSTDPDGPTTAYQLQLSSDGGTTWTPLMPLSESTHFELDTTALASSPDVAVSVMATDGFNTSYATAQVQISNALKIQGTNPYDGEEGVDVNTPVSVIFISALDETTLSTSTFRVSAGGQTVSGELSYDPQAKMATFTPDAPLAYSTEYRVDLTSGLTDGGGNPLTPTTWTFSTETDTQPPVITSVFPVNGASGVPLNAQVQVELSEPFDPATVTTSTVQLLDGKGSPVAGKITVFSDNRGALFVADNNLIADSSYTVAVTTDITDVQGNPLELDFQSEFRTGEDVFDLLRIVDEYRDSPIDVNGDGLYEKLTISVAVEVTQAGNYNLNGRLLTRDRDLIAWSTSGNKYLDIGIHWLDLVFGAVPIRNSGVDGPYTLDSLNFYAASNPSMGDVAVDPFETYPYDFMAFYSAMTLGPLPDQLLEINTAKDNAIALPSFTKHESEPLDTISYTLLIKALPEAGVSIDSDDNVDINPTPNTESESDVTIEAKDQLGNKVQSTFHVSVQAPAPGTLVLDFPNTAPTNSQKTIKVDIYDQFGRLLKDLTTVYFETTLGAITPESVDTLTGKASATLLTGGQTGNAFVTVRTGDIEKLAKIEVYRGTTYIVTPSAGSGGSVTPSAPQSVNAGATRSFTVKAQSGYTRTATVGGTCPKGAWSNNTWTTGAINANCTVGFGFHLSNRFTDVLTNYWAWQHIDAIADAGITTGCGGNRYCPSNDVSRAEMAAFLLRGIHGGAYQPPAPTGTRFRDVPKTHWAARWIEQLATEGVTKGCGGGRYCPENTVSRAEMAAFLLRTKYGSSYNPPAASGKRFSDVPITHWAAPWIEKLAADGVTTGCGGGKYCPESRVTRSEMAVFLARIFSLPLPPRP